LLVEVARTGLEPGIHTVDFVLGANSAIAVDLTDGAIKRLLRLLQGGTKEAITTKHLCLVFDTSLLSCIDVFLVLADTNIHVLLGLVLRIDS